MFGKTLFVAQIGVTNEYFPIHKFLLSILQNRSNNNDSRPLKSYPKFNFILPYTYH